MRSLSKASAGTSSPSSSTTPRTIWASSSSNCLRISASSPASSHTTAAFEIPVTVAIENRFGTITLVASTAPDLAGTAAFTYASDYAPVDGLTLDTGATARFGPAEIETGAYTISQIAPEGWTLNSISCAGDSDGGSSIDLDAGTLTLDADPGEALVCTFANVRDEAYIRTVTQQAIRSFMAVRADRILSESPDLSRRLSSGRTGATPNAFAMDMTRGRMNATLSTSLSAIRQEAEESEKQMPDAERFSLDGRTGRDSLDVWFQASYSSVSDERGGFKNETDFGLYSIGADFMANDRLLFGALIQLDQAETITGDLSSEVEGTGWMAGPYVAVKLTDGLFFDARGALGGSDNTVNPIGTYRDEFITERYLAEAHLTGEIITGNWRLSPRAGLAYFGEEQEAYRDSLGFDIPSQTITIGRFTAGPEVSYRYERANGAVWQPYVSLNAVWDYDDTSAIQTNGALIAMETLRADARFGVNADLSNGGVLGLEFSTSGIGQGDFKADTGMIRLRLPLSLN